MKKSQISLEFIIIFTMVFAVITGFIYLINLRLSEIGEQQELMEMRHLANNIISESILASAVSSNYLRKFDVPPKISGKEYNLSLEEGMISIILTDDGRIVREYFTVLPVPVKGGFAKNIRYNNTEHCITKSSDDGIRIARNQVSLDTNITHVVRGQEFFVLFSLNCVENIRSVRVTISYDNSTLEFLPARIQPITRADTIYLNPLFRGNMMTLDYTGKDLGFAFGYEPFIKGGRYTTAVIGEDCASGSGNILKLTFKVRDDAIPQETEIKFDDLFHGQEILVLDCKTNRYTTEGIPASRKNARIIVQ